MDVVTDCGQRHAYTMENPAVVDGMGAAKMTNSHE
jgi:hypothetical protein